MSWYDELSWMEKYRFPLYPQNKSVIECLEEWMSDYNQNLQTYVKFLSQADVEKISWYTQNLRNAHNSYLQGEYAKAFTLFDETMEKIKDNFPTVYVGRQEDNIEYVIPYYRICTGNKPFAYKDCLHIPYSKRYLASTNRFSAPGMPCSYMASNERIAWCECGMPDVYQLATFNARERTKKLIRLDINPLDIRSRICDGRPDVEKKATELCYILPLMAACSVVAMNKGMAFEEAYIIPQMLMAWIKTCTDYVGVRYRSDADNVFVQDYGGYNIAMPAIAPDETGYSTELMRIFKEEDAKVENKNSVELFIKTYKRQMEDLDAYRERTRRAMQQTMNMELVNNIYREILGTCDIFDILLNTYKKGANKEKYAITVAISRIQVWCKLCFDEINENFVKVKGNSANSENDIKEAEIIIRDFNYCVLRFARSIRFPY